MFVAEMVGHHANGLELDLALLKEVLELVGASDCDLPHLEHEQLQTIVRDLEQRDQLKTREAAVIPQGCGTPCTFI